MLGVSSGCLRSCRKFQQFPKPLLEKHVFSCKAARGTTTTTSPHASKHPKFRVKCMKTTRVKFIKTCIKQETSELNSMKTTRLAVTCCDFSKILSKKSAKRLDWSINSKVITRPPVSLGSSKGLGYLMMKRSAREVLQVLPFLPNKFQIPIGFWSLPDVPSQRSKKHVCVTCVCVCAASSPLQFIYDYLTPGKHGAFSGVRCFFRSLHPVQLLVWHTGYLDVKNNAACDKQHDVWRAAQNKNPKMDQWIIKEWFLVGGFNPSEKYARQIGSFLKGSGWKQQKTWNHHLLFDVQNMDHQRIVCSSLDVQSFRTSKILQNPCHAMEKNAHLSLEISWIQGKNSWVKC